MIILAKFQLQQIEDKHFCYGHPGSPRKVTTFIFIPNYNPEDPEDQRFAKASPTGEFKIQVDNPPVAAFLRENHGKQFKVMFEVVD